MSETDAAWTVQRLLTWTTAYFQRQGVDEPRLSCEVLLAHATGMRRIDLYARFDDVPGDEPRTLFRELVRRAAAHEPIAYLVGEKEFFSLRLNVGPGVLIPRAETERLVEVVLDGMGDRDAMRVLDLGTGSGCIAIALLKQCPGATAVATDISDEALAFATSNAVKHGVEDRLELRQGDRFEPLREGDRFDFIVSNPPYVASGDMAGLDRVVRDYEPATALTDGEDGLAFYRSIAEDARTYLRDDGRVAVEVADGMANAVRSLFEQRGWTLVGVWKDRVVGQERVVMFR